jgi:preprotein translocase SecE subunit
MIKFFREVFGEIKNLSFPSRKETLFITLVSIVTITLVSILILIIDFIASKTVGLIFGI